MGREEQIEEREVLDSIFPEEITDISEVEYRISITLDIPDDDEEPPIILLTVRYPPEYPDKAPHLEISAPQNATSHSNLDLAEDKAELLQGLEATIEENLGMAMVFSLVTTLKDAAEQLVLDRKQAAVNAHEEAVLAAEREENKKFNGTPVTPETFIAWRAAFFKEMEEIRVREEEERLAEMKKARVKEPVKLTGRQLWERGLAGGAVEEEGDDDGISIEDIRKLKVEDS